MVVRLMCLYGNYFLVNVNKTNRKNKVVAVDACISKEIDELNKAGVLTIGCCCSHGDEEYNSHVLFLKESVEKMIELGYNIEKYYYIDGSHCDVFISALKTGCNTFESCKEWHKINSIPYIKNQGILELL